MNTPTQNASFPVGRGFTRKGLRHDAGGFWFRSSGVITPQGIVFATQSSHGLTMDFAHDGRLYRRAWAGETRKSVVARRAFAFAREVATA